MLCSSLLIHLAKTLVSLLTDGSQLFGRASLGASAAANTAGFLPDVAPALLKRCEAPKNSTWKHSAGFFRRETPKPVKLQHTSVANALTCPRGVFALELQTPAEFPVQARPFKPKTIKKKPV